MAWSINGNYVWLDPFQGYVGSLPQGAATTTSKTIICEDNAACITQFKEGYIKGDRTKRMIYKRMVKLKWYKSDRVTIQPTYSLRRYPQRH